MRTMEEIAAELIGLVSGDDSQHNVEGVAEVLEGLIKGNNNSWEQYLARGTNEILMQDNVCCPGCGLPVVVKRTANVVRIIC